jgi:FkbM family methyltransferase
VLIEDLFERYPQIRPRRVLHIGACLCEERGYYQKHGLADADVVWIEANPEVVARARALYPQATILQGLVSEREGDRADFHVTNNLQSSSMLELELHRDEHPEVVAIDTLTLETATVPSLLKRHGLAAEGYDFVNLDIQGAELRALRGMESMLASARAIYTEVNEKEIYAGCARFDEIRAFLGAQGFQCAEVAMTKHGWGDALFLKSS